MVFDSEHYNVFMYVSISIVLMLIFFNSINIVAEGLENGEEFGRRLTGYVVEEVQKDLGNNKEDNGKFNNYLTGLVVEGDIDEIENLDLGEGEELDQDTINQFAVDLEKKKDVDVQENPDGELYTEGSYMIYYTLLGFLAFCVFLLSVVFFLPRLKEYT
tara:strand:- start:753 stop:1229 length:477 start_codon:yes stop_codon:yes gene_type:complete